jgi:hypothetical protein
MFVVENNGYGNLVFIPKMQFPTKLCLIYYFMTKEMKFDTRCETFAMM